MRPVKSTQKSDYAYLVLMNLDSQMSSDKSSASSYQSAQSVVPASAAATTSVTGGVAAPTPTQAAASVSRTPGATQPPGRQSARAEQAMTSTPVGAHGPASMPSSASYLPSDTTPALPVPVHTPLGTPVIGSNGRGG